MMSSASVFAGRTPPQPLPTRGRDLTRHCPPYFGAWGCSRDSPPLWGRWPTGQRGSFLPHSNIDPKTRKRAKTLRTERTKAEAVMWRILRDFRPMGARFRRETPVGPYIADFAWLSARIIVEVDGDSHETDAGRQHDQRRDQFLRSQGFTILRFDNAQVLDGPDHVLITLEDHMKSFLKMEHP